LYTPFELPLTLLFSNCVVGRELEYWKCVDEIIKCNLTTFAFVFLTISVITLKEELEEQSVDLIGTKGGFQLFLGVKVIPSAYFYLLQYCLRIYLRIDIFLPSLVFQMVPQEACE